ncbi:MAG: 3-deoxy-manno-octulosonate cytidylyltransferase [Gemmatimonadaceae bacterium]
MSVLTVIPARLGATRLSRKPLRLLGGVPLVIRVFERVHALKIGDLCVVATDDIEVLNACRDHDVPAVLTSPDHPSGTDRVAEVAQQMKYRSFEFILNVQGDEPFVTSDALRAAVSQVTSGNASIGTVAVRASAEVLQKPDVVKVIRAESGHALYFSRAPIPFLRELDDSDLRNTLVRQHIGVYAYTRQALLEWVSLPPHPLELVERLEQLRPLAHGMQIGVADVAVAPERGIDTEEDLTRANARWLDLASNTADYASLTPTPTPSTP